MLEVAVAGSPPLRAAVRREARGAAAQRRGLERVADPEALPDELDRDFHRGIVGLTGNEHLIALLEPMWTMRQALYTTLGRRSWSPQHTQRTAVEHRAIYEALRAGDPELAAFAMERTCGRSWPRCSRTRRSRAPPPASSPRGPTHVHRHRWDRPADHGDGLLATPVLVHEQPRGPLGVGRTRRRPVPRGAHRRRGRGPLRPGARGPRHPHERRLPPRRRSRRQVVDACTRSSASGHRDGETVPASDEWVHPPGSLLAEVFGAGGCRLSSAGGRAGRSSSTSCGGSRRPAPTSP